MVPGRNKHNCRNAWLKTQNIKINKSPWSEEEDLVLKKTVEGLGDKHWTAVANSYNKHFTGKERTPKQCRERWKNYLDPAISKYIFMNRKH